MLQRKSEESMVVLFTVVSIFLILLAFSTGCVFAGGGSIAMAHYYPDDGGTYAFIDHFLEMTTAVNANTTVSVSIDGGSLIPMTFQGIRSEMVSGDAVVRDWYTWQLSIPALTASGSHTFQFFSHYYVWQDVDQYWAEFDSYSTVKSFTIAYPAQASAPTVNPVYIFAAIAISPIVALLIVVTFFLRNRAQCYSQTR
jgi:hypothetical protein